MRRMKPEVLPTLKHALLIALGLSGATSAMASTGDEPSSQTPPVCSTEIEGRSCQGPGDASFCLRDADCTDGPSGRCLQKFGMIGSYCDCEYACATDAECSGGEVCVCGPDLGADKHSTCVPSECEDGSECESGSCQLSVYYNGCAEKLQMMCRTGDDQCADDTDCPEGETCAYDGAALAWTCQGIMCIIGRPLVIEGAARTAAAEPREDWLADMNLVTEPPAEVAVALARYWGDVAALEHASVASFARFTLELLAQGAPPELVADAQRAALDEVEHARLAWTLASLWSRRQVGPGPLSMNGLVPACDLEEMVTALVKEACVGETLGAAEAKLLAEEVRDPVLASALHRIAADEQRHAELAWRTLHWLFSLHGACVRDAALTAEREAEAELLAVKSAAPADEMVAPEWGLVSEATSRQRRREMLQMVVRPVLAATLELPCAA